MELEGITMLILHLKSYGTGLKPHHPRHGHGSSPGHGLLSPSPLWEWGGLLVIIYICIFVSLYLCMFVCTYVGVCVCMCVNMLVC